MNKHLVCILLTLAVAAGCSFQRGGGGASSRIAPVPAGSFAQQWVNDLKLNKKDTADELHLRDDTLFVYSKTDLVYAVSRRGGDLKYLAAPEITGGTLRPPVVIDNFVVYPCGSSLEIFNNVGRPVRTVVLEKPTRSGAANIAGKLYLGLDHFGGTGVLASVDLNRPYHFVNWEMLTGGAVNATPAIFDKVIYTGGDDGKLYAVNEARKPVWSLPGGSNIFNTQGRFIADLKADDYGVYAANTDSKLYCIDRNTGRVKWQFFANEALRTSPVVFAATVYQFVPKTGIVAIDKANGQFNRQPKWIVKDAVKVLSEDAANVYLASSGGRILAVDKKTGQTQFTSKSKWDMFATNTTDSTIFAANRDGRVMGITPVLREGEVGIVVMAE